MGESNELLTGADFRRMIAGAYSAFARKHEIINNLNVFPVPDGDTGTNMLRTIGSVNQAITGADALGIGKLSRLAADSAIMGARGNSGVILAQLFRGIARGLTGKETATSSEMGKAFQYGVLYAYRAVVRPVEGTILTVAKGIGKGTQRAVQEQLRFTDILREAIQSGKKELARTPDLLPVLKAAGVVDAGGQGLIVLLEGCLDGLSGLAQESDVDFDLRPTATVKPMEQTLLVHPYCTEFLVMHPSLEISQAKSQLDPLGESLIVAAGTEAMKIHIHTAHPGKILEIALAWGTLHDIKIDNMADQHRPMVDLQAKQHKLGIISVSPGAGLSELMQRLGTVTVIDGGQTMNPAVEELVNAVHYGQADRYIILPNNKNIILAANQAKKLLGDKVAVVATKSVPQGLAALLAFDEKADMEHNVTRMCQQAENVISGGVTIAVRDSVLGSRPIRLGQYIGVADSQVVVAEDNVGMALKGLLKILVTDDSELLSLYYGAELEKQVAEQLATEIANEYENLEVQVYQGDQPHYQFLIGLE